MTEGSLLAQVVSLSVALSRASKDELKPFSGQIGQLSELYRKLDCDLRKPEREHTVEDSPTEIDPGGDGKPERARQRDDVKAIVRSAIGQIPRINEAVWNFKQPLEIDQCL